MELMSHRNRREIESLVAARIAIQIRSILRKKKFVVLGLVGGNSVSGVYSAFVKEDVDWSKVHIFLLDERFTPLFSKWSNGLIVKNYFSGVVPLKNIHYFHQKYESVSQYSKGLLKHGGKVDIAIMSSGKDGHVASLFPHHESVKDKSKGFIEVHRAPKLPRKRMSASRSVIEKTDYVHLLFFGSKKKRAFDKFMDESLSVEDVPAKACLKSKHCFVYSDF